MQLPGDQKASENSGTIDTRDSMEIDALPGNEKSGKEEKIAAEIEQLEKEQKKAQIKSELLCLREHPARGFVKNILEQESYL